MSGSVLSQFGNRLKGASPMDLLCTRCGEPWDMYHVLHESPEDFERVGSRIARCPSCAGKQVRLSRSERERLDAIAHVADMLGDDVDGFAAFLDDMDGEGGDL